MDSEHTFTGEDLDSLAEFFDLLARFDAEDQAGGTGQANLANLPLDAS